MLVFELNLIIIFYALFLFFPPRFKYLLVNSANNLVAETNWSNNITLYTSKESSIFYSISRIVPLNEAKLQCRFCFVPTVKSPDSLGSGYAGRSAAMVVITAILSVAAALLLLFLLIILILAW